MYFTSFPRDKVSDIKMTFPELFLFRTMYKPPSRTLRQPIIVEEEFNGLPATKKDETPVEPEAELPKVVKEEQPKVEIEEKPVTKVHLKSSGSPKKKEKGVDVIELDDNEDTSYFMGAAEVDADLAPTENTIV